MEYCFGARGRVEGSQEGAPLARRPAPPTLKPQVVPDPDYLLSRSRQSLPKDPEMEVKEEGGGSESGRSWGVE